MTYRALRRVIALLGGEPGDELPDVTDLGSEWLTDLHSVALWQEERRKRPPGYPNG
jgi:hypothetical protein